MRVLMINSVCGIGSTGRIVAELYRFLEKAGHTCCVAYGRGSAPEGLRTIKIGQDRSVYLHGILNRLTDRHGFYSRRATERFLAELEDWKPDLIHLHNIHGYYLHIGLLFEYLKKRQIPVIWTLHDCWAMTGHCAYFDRTGCERWKTVCHNCPQKRTYPGSWLADASSWNFRWKKELFTGLTNALLITPSHWLETVVRQSFLKEYAVRTIYNGIDLECFRPLENNFRERYGLQDKYIILGVANIWEARKGLQCFVELSKVLNPQYQIVMVGIDQKNRKQIPDNILALPRTESVRELAEIYTAADIFLNGSTEETMGLVTVEALACGTPVIAFDRTAIPETFDKTCGVLIPAGEDREFDFTELARRVQAAVEGESWKSFRMQDCLAFARMFDKNSRYGQYVETVEEWGRRGEK